MANVKFKQVTNAQQTTEAIEEDKLLYNYESQKIHIDKGGSRIPFYPTDTTLSTTSTNAVANSAITGSIVNTLAEVNAITANSIPCGTKPLKELSTNLQWIDITSQCTWSGYVNSTALSGLMYKAYVNPAIRTVRICAYFSAGIPNSTALVIIPSQYIPGTSGYLPIAKQLDSNGMAIEHFLNLNTNSILELHSISQPTTGTVVLSTSWNY